jgi:hypothetical protein
VVFSEAADWLGGFPVPSDPVTSLEGAGDLVSMRLFVQSALSNGLNDDSVCDLSEALSYGS